MSEDELIVGDIVTLIEKPTGYVSKNYALTIGNNYKIVSFIGSCVVTTSDDPQQTAMYHYSRVKKVKEIK